MGGGRSGRASGQVDGVGGGEWDGVLSRCICAMGGYGDMGIGRRNMDMDMDMGMGWNGARRGGHWEEVL